MATLTTRQKLITYLADADDNKVQALYTLLEKELEHQDIELSGSQIEILERERELHQTGQSKSYTRDEARSMIQGRNV